MQNKNIKQIIALILCLICIFGCASSAEVRYPQKQESSFVTDSADIFSMELIESINDLNKVVSNKTDVNLYVASVRFLDGENKEQYAKELFKKWELETNDFLLLLSIGNEEYFALSGKDLERKISNNLVNGIFVSSGFTDEFKKENYNNAVALFFNAYTSLLQKNFNVKFKDKLITNYRNTPSYTMKTNDTFKFNFDTDNKKDNSNIRNFILLLLLIGYIINKKNSKPKKGCGCSSIIIIYILFTILGKLLD
ncbi:MAG: TPM domain-containing protein [Christensenellaceae bacterium]|nr:TPM domain-containing protein [Christensenellaceae bacterium]